MINWIVKSNHLFLCSWSSVTLSCTRTIFSTSQLIPQDHPQDGLNILSSSHTKPSMDSKLNMSPCPWTWVCFHLEIIVLLMSWEFIQILIQYIIKNIPSLWDLSCLPCWPIVTGFNTVPLLLYISPLLCLWLCLSLSFSLPSPLYIPLPQFSSRLSTSHNIYAPNSMSDSREMLNGLMDEQDGSGRLQSGGRLGKAPIAPSCLAFAMNAMWSQMHHAVEQGK